MKLVELRNEIGLTIRELGVFVNIAPSTLSSIESGKRQITVEQTRCLSEFFGVSEKFLLGESSEWVRVYNGFDETMKSLSESDRQKVLDFVRTELK